MKQQIQCTFSSSEDEYICTIENQDIDEFKELEIIGDHLVGKRNNNVSYVYIKKCTLSKISQGLTAFFPSFEALDIEETNLSCIKRDDLKEYCELQFLFLHKNKILFLEEDLLSDLKNLKTFSAIDNPINFIEPNILNYLNNLKKANFENCGCISAFYCNSQKLDSLSLEELKKQLHEIYEESPWKRFSEKKQADIELLHDIKQMIQDETSKDFTITVGAEEFDAHKFMLAARSPVLAEMIKNNKDADSLNLVDISPAIFREIYTFIYTNELPTSNDVDFDQLLIASKKLKLEKLTKFAVTKLLNKVTAENAFELLVLSNKYGFMDLRKKAFHKLKKLLENETIDESIASKPEKLKKLIDIKREKDQILKDLAAKFNAVINDE